MIENLKRNNYFLVHLLRLMMAYLLILYCYLYYFPFFDCFLLSIQEIHIQVLFDYSLNFFLHFILITSIIVIIIGVVMCYRLECLQKKGNGCCYLIIVMVGRIVGQRIHLIDQRILFHLRCQTLNRIKALLNLFLYFLDGNLYYSFPKGRLRFQPFSKKFDCQRTFLFLHLVFHLLIKLSF